MSLATDSNIKVISILDHPKYKSLFNEGSGKVVHNTQQFQELYMTCALLGHILGVPKKRGISECYSVCFTDDFIWNQENLFMIHLKNKIHMFVPNTIPLLSDIRELRNISFIIRFVCT